MNNNIKTAASLDSLHCWPEALKTQLGCTENAAGLHSLLLAGLHSTSKVNCWGCELCTGSKTAQALCVIYNNML